MANWLCADSHHIECDSRWIFERELPTSMQKWPINSTDTFNKHFRRIANKVFLSINFNLWRHNDRMIQIYISLILFVLIGCAHYLCALACTWRAYTACHIARGGQFRNLLKMQYNSSPVNSWAILNKLSWINNNNKWLFFFLSCFVGNNFRCCQLIFPRPFRLVIFRRINFFVAAFFR